MLPELYIVGAGGFGRELYCWLKDTSAWGRDWEFSGFLDDDLSALDSFNHDGKVVAKVSEFVPKGSQLFACGIGNVEMKQKACRGLIEQGAEFVSIVHPTAVIGDRVALGAGVVVCPGVILTCDIAVGRMAMVNLNSTVGHDVTIGEWSTLSPLNSLTAGVSIGDGVFLGSGAHVLPGISVGDGAFVGAGSVVMRDVKNGQKIYGNPARILP
jgi:sugar O-acyltransferase (sialic acid O-acetyltransferase NeuD family)